MTPSHRRGWGVAALLLPLVGGCHLFQGFAIDCLAGQDCARNADDTSGDTADSGPGGPTSGWIVSLVDATDASVFAFDADGTPLKSWPGLGAAFGYPDTLSEWAGAVAYNRSTGAGIVAVNGSFATLDSRGTIVTLGLTFDVGTDIADAEYTDDNYYWFAVHDDVYAWDIRHQQTYSMFPEGLGDATGLGMGVGTIYTSDWADGDPDVWALPTDHGAAVSVVRNISGDVDISDNPFAGPDDKPYGCAKTGAIYDLQGFADGTEPGFVVQLNQGVSDVTDCGWDPGDGSWLVASTSTGIWRISADGTAANVATVPRGSRGLRANFFR